jgi:hypothetical protein
MPRGLNRSGDFRNGTPITLPHEFGNPITTPHDFGNDVTWTPNPTHFGNAVTWSTPDPTHFGNSIGPSQQATPTFSPLGGTYTSAQTVTITSAGADTIYYTTDGSTPTTSSTVYSGPITVSTTETVKALAVKAGLSNSNIGSASYTINIPALAFVTSGALDATGTNPITLDTTGATLLVAVMSTSSAAPTITDSNGNTWNYLTTQTQANAVQSRIAYVFAPTVGAGHVFTGHGGSGVIGFVYAFSGPATTAACFLNQNGAVVNSGSVQPGSVTPAAGGVIITGIVGVLNDTSAATINDSFTGVLKRTSNLQGAAAYLLTTNTTPVSPTWTQGAGSTAAVIAAFQGA